MQLLQRCHTLLLWISDCRSILEQSCVIWHSSLTEENIDNLERTQRTFCKLTLQNKYDSYKTSLLKLNLQPLHGRRHKLCLKFAKDSLDSGTLKDLLPERTKHHTM